MEVFVEGLTIHARHGVYEEERRDGRLFRIDLRVETTPSQEDDLNTTVDYRSLASIINQRFEGASRYLVETLASEILADVFSTHPSVSKADICIRKKASGVPCDPKWVGVRLQRAR